MSDHKQDFFRLDDILTASSLLTRLPLPIDHKLAGARAALATWAYSIVGALLGLIAGLIGAALLWLGIPSEVCAAITLIVLAAMTGALHEDGLADCADGFWGAGTKDRRLEIMKDSRIGVYGALALMLFTIGRWSAISELPTQHWVLAFTAIGAVSRAPMVVAMLIVPNARSSGMSAAVGMPSPNSATICSAIAVGIAVLTVGLTGLWAVCITAIFCALFFKLAEQKIGGQTGDVLGASQQIAELVFLATILSLL